MELLFERFLSEEHGEWPDIVIDLPSGDRRKRVTQYVYQRCGQLGAAMTAIVITYRQIEDSTAVAAKVVPPCLPRTDLKVLHELYGIFITFY